MAWEKMTHREVNLAVARAVGWPVGLIADLQGEQVPLVLESCGLPAHILEWSPLTDWNHAMEAADLAGLFTHHRGLRYCRQDGACVSTKEWVLEIRADGPIGRVFRAESGPAAVCRAILAVYGKTG